MFLFLDVWQYIAFDCTKYLIKISIWLKAKGVAYGISWTFFTTTILVMTFKDNQLEMRQSMRVEDLAEVGHMV